MRISDWSSDVCSSDLLPLRCPRAHERSAAGRGYAQEPSCPCSPRCLPPAIVPLAPAKQRRTWVERRQGRSEEHTSELQSLMRISYAVFCLKKKKKTTMKQRNQK